MANIISGWNFSPANRAGISDRLLKQIFWKPNCRLHGEGFSPGHNSARAENPSLVFSNRARIFSPAKRAWKSEKVSCNRNRISPGPKNEREHAHWLCFRTSVNFLTEICVLRPGWNWARNHNNVSARWAERNFSPGWNAPCNQALSCKKASANVLAHISQSPLKLQSDMRLSLGVKEKA